MIGHPVQQLTTSPRALATLVAACAMPFGSVSAAENVRPDGQILEEVAVTASRVAQPGFKAPTPTTVITAAELEHTGAPDVAAYLNTLPAFRPSRTPTTTIQSGTAIGVNLIDLRGLGTERSLVLVNSRRHVPTQATGAVDFNVIPSVALGSVEVITGGASAAWGSDAVAGVVNLLFDHDLQGVKFDAQYGTSAEGDGTERRFSAAFGDDVLDGKGHFMIAAEYHKSEGVNRQGDRDWGSRQWQLIANPLNQGPNDGQPGLITRSNVNVINATDGGVIVGPAPIRGFEFGPGGALVVREMGSLVSPPYMVGGSGTCLSCKDIALSVPFERRSMLATFDYELSDDVRFFFEGSYAESDAGPSVLVSPFSFNIPLAADNAFMPDQVRSLLANNGLSSMTIGRTNVDFGFTEAESSSNTRRAVVGFEGTMFGDWSWQMYYQNGETTFRNRQPGNLIVANFNLAIDAVRDPVTNNIVCRAAANAASLPAGLQSAARQCVPINLFGFGAPSAEAIDYVTATSSSEHRIRQDVLAAEVRGDLVNLWAGPLSVAAGLEYRKEEVDVVADPISQAGGFFMTNPKALTGDFDVREAFAEAALPLLKDKPFANSLALNGAIRRTDYSTVGMVTTSKIGATWEPHQSVLLRGTVSRDIRAPNIQELYLTRLQSFFSGLDPCDSSAQAANPTVAANCQAVGLPANFVGAAVLVPSVTGGNPDLEEEQADTMTAGIVLSPAFMPGFRASFDWFDIEIDDAITQLTAQGLLTSCYSSSAFPNQTCASITRGPTGQLSEIRATFLNTASFHTSGVDAEFQYAFDLADLFDSGRGAVNLRLIGTYLIEKNNSPDGIIEFERAGEVGVGNISLSGLGGMPRWRWESSIGYATDRFGVDAQIHYVGKGKIDTSMTPEDIDRNEIGDEWTLDLSARYTLQLGSYSTEIFSGVNNVLNRDPPLIPLNFLQSYATNPGLYDVMGRYYYAGVRVRL